MLKGKSTIIIDYEDGDEDDDDNLFMNDKNKINNKHMKNTQSSKPKKRQSSMPKKTTIITYRKATLSVHMFFVTNSWTIRKI